MRLLALLHASVSTNFRTRGTQHLLLLPRVPRCESRIQLRLRNQPQPERQFSLLARRRPRSSSHLRARAGSRAMSSRAAAAVAAARAPASPISATESQSRSPARALDPAGEEVSFASDADPNVLSGDLAALLVSGSQGGKWHLTSSRAGLERSFRFKTFGKTWEFMNAVAAECVVRRHHPEWSNLYNTAFIRWTTHSPPGLSAKDVQMALFCDEQAAAFGEVEAVTVPTPAAATAGDAVGRELADVVAVAGGNCCVPKSKR